MFTLRINMVIVAFVSHLAPGLGVKNRDRKMMQDAEKELAYLRSALAAKQLEVDQGKELYEKTVATAYSVVLDYEKLFCEMKKRNETKQSAVILPFRRFD